MTQALWRNRNCLKASTKQKKTAYYQPHERALWRNRNCLKASTKQKKQRTAIHFLALHLCNSVIWLSHEHLSPSCSVNLFWGKIGRGINTVKVWGLKKKKMLDLIFAWSGSRRLIGANVHVLSWHSTDHVLAVLNEG